MATIVSSGLDYINKNPHARLSFGQVEHELQHVKIRERVSSFISIASTALLVIAVAGVITGGMFIIGALAAIAGISALYTLAAREAESSLREKQICWTNGTEPSAPSLADLADVESEKNGFLGLNWFSERVL